jgi:hypothetical protein
MAHWDTYQSLIQLSVGVNLLFGLFDAVVAPRLARLAERRKAVLDAIAANPHKKVSAATITSATASISRSSKAVRRITAFGVYPSIASAVAAFALLIISSENAHSEIGTLGRLAVYATVAWQAIFFLAFTWHMLKIEFKLTRIR